MPKLTTEEIQKATRITPEQVQKAMTMALGTMSGLRTTALPKAFSTLSAQVGEKAMPEAQAALAKDLEAAGLKFHATQGTYGGKSEPSFMVEHDSSPESMKLIEDLGKKYNQESVLHSTETNAGRINELRDTNGKPLMTGIGESEPGGDYTDSPIYGKFNLNLEAPQSKLIHYSNQPGLKSIDPNFMGSSGVKGAQYKKGVPENKSSFYYEEGAQPEDIVKSNSSTKYTVTPGESKIYDLTKDPNNAIQSVKDANQGAFNEDILHGQLKSQGYDGVKWNQNGTNVIQMYKPMSVETEESMAGGGRIGYDEGGNIGLPPGAIPMDEFQTGSPNPEQPNTNPGLPEGAIPMDEFEEMPTGPAESLKAFGEGAARGVIGPVAPYLEHKMGVLNRDISRRAETPAAALGETAGIIASAVSGKGVGAALSKASDAVLEAANLAKPVGYMAKIGSGALQSATEFAVLEASDQAAKSLYDPELSAENAAAAIGISAALGGAAGAFTGGVLNPLWKATVGSKVENLLKGITERYGVEGGVPAATSHELSQQAGVEIRPEFQALIDRKPGAMQFDSALAQDDVSSAGRKYQKARANQMANLEEATSNTFNTTADDISSIPSVDKYSTGRLLGETLNAELKPEVEAVARAYENKVDALKKTAVTDLDKKEMADKIAQTSMDEGWAKAQNPSSLEFANTTTRTLQGQETSDDLKKFITNLNEDNPYGSDTYRVAKLMRNIVRDQQEKIISRDLGPQELAEYNALRGQYKNLIGKMENVDTHLKVGRWDGPESFMRAIDEMGTTNGEAVLRRLSGEGKANALEVLKDFPRTLSTLRQYHVNGLLTDAASEPTTEMSRLNINRLNTELQKMSPQLRNFITTPEMQQRLQAIQGIVDGMKDPNHNWSNTARTIHNMTAHNPSPMSLVMALMGHGDVGLLSYLGHLGMNEGLPAMKYSMLKFLGSKAPVNVDGFKAMASFADSAMKGQLLMQRAAKNVFKAAGPVLASHQIPDDGDRKKLDKYIAKVNNDPMSLSKLQNSQTGHYLPQHQVALTQSITNTAQYLAKLKPQSYRSAPLDHMIRPTPEQEARYNRALDIANQPAVVLQSVKDGTLQQTDLQDLQAMYPQVYKQLTQMITTGVLATKDNEDSIPYKTRMGISLFLGQPMDSTMMPQNIMAAQPPPTSQPQQQTKPSKQGEMKMKNSKSYMTPTQNAESDRSNRAD